MLMKGAGRDCTALFSILIFNFLCLFVFNFNFSILTVSLPWKDFGDFIWQIRCVLRSYDVVELEFAFWTLTGVCFRQVSRMGERRVSDGEVHCGHFGRPSNVTSVLLFLYDLLAAVSSYLLRYHCCS
jgi:hypothetical protein